MMTRFVKTRDCGRGIPGQGGAFDRFDGLNFASAAACFVITLGQGF